jgi:hypothetical protein
LTIPRMPSTMASFIFGTMASPTSTALHATISSVPLRHKVLHITSSHSLFANVCKYSIASGDRHTSGAVSL